MPYCHKYTHYTTLNYTTLHYTVVEDGDNDEDENYTGETLSIIITIKSFFKLLSWIKNVQFACWYYFVMWMAMQAELLWMGQFSQTPHTRKGETKEKKVRSEDNIERVREEISRDKTVSIRNTSPALISATELGSLSPGDPNKVSIVSEVSTFFQWFLISRFYYALV